MTHGAAAAEGRFRRHFAVAREIISFLARALRRGLARCEVARGTRRLLLVDGDPDARAEIGGWLEKAGWRVVAVGSAARALGLLRRGSFAGAMVDVEVADGSGLEAVSALRAERPGLAVIVTAGENTRELEKAVRQQEVAYYYVKGFDRSELVQAVADAFGGRRMKHPAKILVVDDDPDYQAAVKSILEGAGYEVVQAQSKEEGLEALKMGNPDLVILDIMMTKTTDGFHFLYEMKADRKSRKPPILAVSCITEATGFDFSPTGDDDYFPADDFLAKPVAPAELLRHVEALLERRAAAQ